MQILRFSQINESYTPKKYSNDQILDMVLPISDAIGYEPKISIFYLTREDNYWGNKYDNITLGQPTYKTLSIKELNDLKDFRMVYMLKWDKTIDDDEYEYQFKSIGLNQISKQISIMEEIKSVFKKLESNNIICQVSLKPGLDIDVYLMIDGNKLGIDDDLNKLNDISDAAKDLIDKIEPKGNYKKYFNMTVDLNNDIIVNLNMSYIPTIYFINYIKRIKNNMNKMKYELTVNLSNGYLDLYNSDELLRRYMRLGKNNFNDNDIIKIKINNI